MRLLHVVFNEAAAASRALAAALPLDFGAPGGPCGWGPQGPWAHLETAATGSDDREGPLKWAIEAAALFKPPSKLKA